MDKLSFQNALFNTYAIAACIMILKPGHESWLTVVRMMQVKGGFRSPEDIKKTILNPNPSAEQLAPNEYVDPIRRILAERS
jgi:glutathione S-transferase